MCYIIFQPLGTHVKKSRERKAAISKQSLVNMNSLVYGLQTNTDAMATSSGGLRKPTNESASRDRALERLQDQLEIEQESSEDVSP